MSNRRDSRQARGYGRDHLLRREAVKRAVLAGKASCWRCGEPILPTEPFDLGHDDHDRTKYRGPEHRRCNRATAGRRNGAAPVNLSANRDDPERAIFFGPPSVPGGRPWPWSRPWLDWRDESPPAQA